MPFRWAALRGRYYVHLVQMHGPFPKLVRVGAPLFAGLSRWAVVPVAAVLLAVAPLGGPSARAKFRREGAAWGLHERRSCLP